MDFPSDLKYTKDHEWVRIDSAGEGEDAVATVGITDFAQTELGDIVYVDIDSTGKDLEADNTFGTVEAVKTVSDLFMPVAGTVLEVNPMLDDSPEVVNKDPYGEGWMIKIKLKTAADIDSLMDAASYEKLVKL